MTVWTFRLKDEIESFAPGASLNPVYTYTVPERTHSYVNGEGWMAATVLPAQTVEVVSSAQATSSVAITHGEMVKRFDEDTALYLDDYGCFKNDNLDQRIFTARPKVNIPVENTTIAACYQACLVEGWLMAGLQNGQ
jgi:hypothetical protein